MSFIFVWLLSFSIMHLRFIHAVANINGSFLSIAEYYSAAYIYHNWFVHSTVDGCFFSSF